MATGGRHHLFGGRHRDEFCEFSEAAKDGRPSRARISNRDDMGGEYRRTNNIMVMGNGGSGGLGRRQQNAVPINGDGDGGGYAGYDYTMLGRMEREKSRSLSRGRSGSKGRRPEKYLPPKKEEVALFDESRQIRKGEKFKEVYEKHEESIVWQAAGEEVGAKKLEDFCKRIDRFEQCRFSDPILENIKMMKMANLTPIQKVVMPIILKKRNDLVGHAPTGSGKTAAFLLPIISELQLVVAKRGGIRNTDRPYAIIVSPTKELANQLYEDCCAFSLRTGVTVVRTFGHIPMRGTMEDMDRGCDIFIATCGRLQQFFEDSYLFLDKLRYLVLDEADKLLEIEDFRNCIKKLKKHKMLDPEHRVLMFSATYSEKVKALAQEILRPDFIRVQIGKENVPVETVDQQFLQVRRFVPEGKEEENKLNTLIRFLVDHPKTWLATDLESGPKIIDYHKVPKTIVFVEQKRHTVMVALTLRNSNIRALSLNSDHPLKIRYDVVEQFATDKCDVVVATDVASRGLNFANVQIVINFDLPSRDPRSSQDEYVHRIGRTGRIGNLGQSISYFDPTNDTDRKNASYFVEKLEESGANVPSWLRQIADEQKEWQRELDRIKVDDESASSNQQQNIAPIRKGKKKSVVEEEEEEDTLSVFSK